jgi:hypothetical protein
MPLSTEETLSEIAGNSSHPADTGKVSPDTEAAKSTVEGDDEGQGAKGAADGSQGQDDTTGDGKDTSKDAGDGKDKDGKQAAASDTGEDGKKKPYHEDPAWQRIIEERNEARGEVKELRDKVSKLEGAFEALTSGTKAEKKEAFQELPNILDKTPEEIEEMMTKDPKGFLKLLTDQIEATVEKKQEASREKQKADERQKAINATYAKYAKEHPDFETMWKKGDIQNFMDENPGHTPLSAHTMLTVEARIKAEVDKQVAEKTKEIEENLLAKKRAGTLGAKETPAARKDTGASEDKALNDTKSKGGRTAFLAERLRRLRSAVQT